MVFVLEKKKRGIKSYRFMTRLRRYATAAWDSAESTTSRVVIYKKHRHASSWDTTPRFSTKISGNDLVDIFEKAALTKAAKYSVSVSFPPWLRITSVTAANTAQICETHQVTMLQQQKYSASSFTNCIFVSSISIVASTPTNVINNASVFCF